MNHQIAVVTGASRGIGAATVRLLSQSGYSVCVNYRTEQKKAQKICDEINSNGGTAIAVEADVSDVDQVQQLFRVVDRELGPVTALVNNAASIGPNTTVENLDIEDLRRLLSINVTGVVLCTKEAIKRMSFKRKGNGGSIVNVSSGAAHIGGGGSSVHYALTKGAVNSFTIGLAQEVTGEGVRVNAVSPGLTNTSMPHKDQIDIGIASIPEGRAAEPEEIAQAIVWLLSAQASFVSGANIRVAGGRQ